MAKDNSDDRPPMAVAMEWSTRLMAIGLEMALPAGGGYWLDLRIGTSPVFVILGATLGFAVGMFQLLQIARQQGPPKPRS
jgi:F0F1-type ATP synthase assembly protein I